MISRFVDRREELEMLEKEWKSEGGKLIIMYGRRRIGKTRLLLEFIKNKKGAFYVADDTSVQIQVDSLKRRLAELLNDDLLLKLQLNGWEQLFEYFSDKIPGDRFYLIIDEFPYLIRADKSILSVMQRVWDFKLSKSKIFIVLSGSAIGTMSEAVLSYSSPLYGRRTRDMLIGELKLEHAMELLNRDLYSALQFYMITGGVPEYINRASIYAGPEDFIVNEFLSQYGYFYREPYFVISQDFREPRIYFSMLNAIAFGNTRPTDIANFVGFNSREIYPYLENLIRLGFVQRKVPFMGNIRNGIYFIKDAMFDFWFNFTYRLKEEVEMGSATIDRSRLSSYFGKRFEILLVEQIAKRLMPEYIRFGSWWHRDREIDLVASDGRKTAFIECKWKNLSEREARVILKELVRKAQEVDSEKRTYGIVAIKIENKEELRRDGYYAFDLEDISAYVQLS